jgi:acetoin utilization protein AcuB
VVITTTLFMLRENIMLTVADIMTTAPISVSGSLPLHVVIGLMKEHACRQLPVMSGDRLIGIVTDRDVRLAMNSPLVLRERTEDDALLHQVTAEDCMTPNPTTIAPDASAREAADLMRTYKFGALPVVSEGKLVGIVTITDILGSYINLLDSQQAP